MRILYYAINGSGLGHLMRCSAIAVAIRKRAAHVHQFLATSANYPAHLRRLKIPTIILPSDDSGSHHEGNRRERTVSAELTARILRHTIREYDPEVVVFDTHAPRRIIEDVRNEGRKATLVFRRCREEYIREYLRDGLFASFDLILLPYTRDEFSDGISPDVLEQLETYGTVRYIGGIAFPVALGKQTIEQMAQRYGVKRNNQLILITAGSGGYGNLNKKFLDNAARAAAALHRKKSAVMTVCVGGPYAAHSTMTHGCSYIQCDEDLQLLMARADLVVAHAGYNSIQEILRTGARAILVPVYRRAEDQAVFAQHLAARGRVEVLPPTATEAAFLRAYEDLLAAPRPHRERVLGAFAAADQILALATPTARYICCRNQSEAPGVSVFDSPTQLADALTQNVACRALVKIDWNFLEPLLQQLGPAVHSRLAGLEVHLGQEVLDQLVGRAAWVYSLIIEAGFDRNLLSFSIDDSSCSSLLADLAQLLEPLHFRALVARIPERALARNPAVIFNMLELCRQLHSNFKVDVAIVEQGFVSVDQP